MDPATEQEAPQQPTTTIEVKAEDTGAAETTQQQEGGQEQGEQQASTTTADEQASATPMQVDTPAAAANGVATDTTSNITNAEPTESQPAATTEAGVKRGIDEVEGGDEAEESAKRAKTEDGGRRAPWQRSDPYVTPQDSPRNHLCKKLKTLLKARRPQDLDCQCECAHHPSELVPTVQHTLLPAGTKVTCSLPHAGNLDLPGSTFVVFPSEQLFHTKGTADVTPQTKPMDSRVTRRLCKHYVKWGSCDLWHECPYVHMVCNDENALTLPSGELFSAVPWRISGPKQIFCEKWLAAYKEKLEKDESAASSVTVECTCEHAHSWEELESPNAHILLPPSDHLPVREIGSVGFQGQSKTYPTEQVYYTEGAWSSLKEFRSRGGQNAVPRQHCADFIRWQKCPEWDKCKNVHVLNLETLRQTSPAAVRTGIRSSAPPGSGPISPPGPIGPDGELRIPRMTTEERRANWPKSILCHRSPCACPCAHSMEELREPPNHYRLPAGCKLRVKTQDGSAMHEYESDQCFLTVGSLPAFQAGMRGETLLRTHCMHFMRLQRCPHWENCQYIHVSHTRGVASPTGQPTVQPTAVAATVGPRGQNGQSGPRGQYGQYGQQRPQAQAVQYQMPGAQAVQAVSGMQMQGMQRQGAQGQTGVQYQFQPQQAGMAMQPGAYMQYGMMDPAQAQQMQMQGYAYPAQAAYGQPQAQAQIQYVNGQPVVVQNASYVQPTAAVQQQQMGVAQQGVQQTPATGVQAQGTGKDTMCPNWTGGVPCQCTRAHGWNELQEPPAHTLMSTTNSKIAIVAEGHPPQIYPCQQIYQTAGAVDVLQGRRTELRHCVDYLRHQKCARWTECPDAHVWRPPQ